MLTEFKEGVAVRAAAAKAAARLALKASAKAGRAQKRKKPDSTKRDCLPMLLLYGIALNCVCRVSRIRFAPL